RALFFSSLTSRVIIDSSAGCGYRRPCGPRWGTIAAWRGPRTKYETPATPARTMEWRKSRSVSGLPGRDCAESGDGAVDSGVVHVAVGDGSYPAGPEQRGEHALAAERRDQLGGVPCLRVDVDHDDV